jgi:hypothetical protein
MKTTHAIAAIAVLAGGVGLVAGAFGATAPNRPPGVSANEWAPISDRMGVVLVDQQPTAMDAPTISPSPASGAAIRKSEASVGQPSSRQLTAISWSSGVASGSGSS